MLWSDCTDPAIVALTKRIDALREQYDPLPAGQARFDLHAKCTELVSERRVLFDRARPEGVR